MNETSLKNLLKAAPETKARVSDRLHQDIMRSVRLAGAPPRKSWRSLAMPALGAALIAVLAAGLIVFKPVQEEPAAPLQATDQAAGRPPAPLLKLGDSLIARLQAAAPAEDELRRELEHLKSDLEKVGIKS